MNAGWTEERIALLKRWWGEGLSGRRIATLLGGVTRKAVIGKAWRLGLPRHAMANKQNAFSGKPSENHRWRQRMKLAAKTKAKKLKLTNARLKATPMDKIVLPIDPPLSECKSLLELGAHECRWPVGDKFCARPACDREFGSYCATHANVAYRGLPEPTGKHFVLSRAA